MLVLTRMPGQRIIISDDIEITVLRVNESKAWIGITAPDDVTVHREEIYSAIMRESAESHSADGDMVP